MKNATSISCPQCSHEFNPEVAISSRIEQDLKIKYTEQVNQLHQQHEARRLELELEKKHIADMRELHDKLVQEQVAQERILLETKLKAELSQL
jgi:protein-disulfide isomerase